MPSSGILSRVALVRTDVSEERSAFISSATFLRDVSSYKSHTQRNIPKDGILP
jgi:hypothetical protein